MAQGQELWLVRHGETEWSLSGAHTGRTDIPLTPRGLKKATVIRQYLERREFALVLTSPLSRARETCRAAGFGDQARNEPNLCEWDYGIYEGRTTTEIRETEPDWTIWTAQITGGESLADVGHRAETVIRGATNAGGDVLMFAHGHIIRVLAAVWLGLPYGAGRHFALDTAGVSVLGYERGMPVLRLWNATPATENGAPSRP